ncbi:26S proteasome non-ATPase regulatory subunit 2 homolog A-like protein, partial [Tanacetum coccineum]
MEPEHNTNNNKAAAEKANPKDDKVPSKDQKKKDDKKDEDLSEEDLALKQQLELYVERVQDADPALQKVALESMRQEIRTSTSSMTSVPKPLKFLRPHYATLKSCYEQMPDSDLKKLFADILSVLALTMSADGEPESLKYRMLGSKGDIGSWGHEYVSEKQMKIVCSLYQKHVKYYKKRDEKVYISSMSYKAFARLCCRNAGCCLKNLAGEIAQD